MLFKIGFHGYQLHHLTVMHSSLYCFASHSLHGIQEFLPHTNYQTLRLLDQFDHGSFFLSVTDSTQSRVRWSWCFGLDSECSPPSTDWKKNFQCHIVLDWNNPPLAFHHSNWLSSIPPLPKCHFPGCLVLDWCRISQCKSSHIWLAETFLLFLTYRSYSQ